MLGGQSSVRGTLLLVLTHCHEHLGQSIAYARMNGVTPSLVGGLRAGRPRGGGDPCLADTRGDDGNPRRGAECGLTVRKWWRGWRQIAMVGVATGCRGGSLGVITSGLLSYDRCVVTGSSVRQCGRAVWCEKACRCEDVTSSGRVRSRGSWRALERSGVRGTPWRQLSVVPGAERTTTACASAPTRTRSGSRRRRRTRWSRPSCCPTATRRTSTGPSWPSWPRHTRSPRTRWCWGRVRRRCSRWRSRHTPRQGRSWSWRNRRTRP